MIIYGNSALARIVALEPDIQPGEFVLGADTCTIGRSPLCQIVVRHAIVSRLHAQIEFQKHGCVLNDASSTNGTFVNGQRITSPHLLRDQDVIGLGGSTATLQFRVATKRTTQVFSTS